MSNIVYDFLTESFLYREENINENYQDYSENQLRKELENYREYVLSNLEHILNDINDDYENTSVFSEMFSSQPIGIDLLKQCSLYVHKFIVNDPLFKITHKIDQDSSFQTSMNQYLGLNTNNKIDRIELVRIIKYMKLLTPGIITGYVKLIPGSFMHEPPKDIPLTYSPNYFSDILQKELLDYFHSNVIVSPMEKTDKGLTILHGRELHPCRGINIDLKNHSEFLGRCYMLFETEVQSFDNVTNKVTFRQFLPDEPPSEKRFNAWVYQSINQVANRFCAEIENEIVLASRLKAQYLTQSPFVDGLLRMNFEPVNDIRKKVTTNTLNTLLKLPLPVIEDASFGEIMSVRLQEGEVFENFRADIEKRFAELRTIKNEEDLRIKLENISHELSEIHVNTIERQTKTLRNKFFRNSAIIVASLAGAVATSGFSLLGAAIAAGQGYNSYQDYKIEVKKNPSYLLWKINRKNKM